MTEPGERLRRIASVVCSHQTMRRLVDPVIADLQFERGEAMAHASAAAAERRRVGHVWRSAASCVIGSCPLCVMCAARTRRGASAVQSWRPQRC